MKTLAILLFLSSLAFGQEVCPLGYDTPKMVNGQPECVPQGASIVITDDLPDNPKPCQDNNWTSDNPDCLPPLSTTCTEHGKPCPRWLHKMIGQYPPLPDDTIHYPKYEAGFWTFRKSWHDPPLRTNKQMFKSKTYVATQIGGAIAMIVACRNPQSGEHLGVELPALLGTDALAYVGGRFFTQSFAVGPGIYQMIHYSITGSK